MSGEKKETVRKEECVGKVGKNLNFFAKSNDLKHAYLSELPMILLVYKEAYFNSDNLDSYCHNPNFNHFYFNYYYYFIYWKG